MWTLYQLVTRVRSDELGPNDLIELSLGLLSCVPIGFGLSLITLEAKTLPSLVAFTASAFPVRDMQRFFQEQMMKRAFAIDTPARTVRPAERNLGTSIDGLSDQTLVRLAELRIVTHRSTESSLAAVVAAVADLDAVQEVTSVLRVEGN